MISALEAIKIKIRNEMNRITDDVINGACADFPAYRFACGVAHGLAFAEEIVKEIEAKVYADEGDDEDGA
jgi:hypothetical protein